MLGCESMSELFAAKRPETYEAFERGEISEDELWTRYFADDRTVDVKAVRQHFVDGYEYVAGMRSLLGEIKRIGNVEVYAFSNYGSLYTEIENKLGLSTYLDWKFVSCDMGLRKPDAAAFTQVLGALGADPARDVVCFVDDSRTNCDAGAAAGLYFSRATRPTALIVRVRLGLNPGLRSCARTAIRASVASPSSKIRPRVPVDDQLTNNLSNNRVSPVAQST